MPPAPRGPVTRSAAAPGLRETPSPIRDPDRAGPFAAPSDWPGRPAAFYLWGSSREIVNRVLLAVSNELDPRSLWLEVACGTGGPFPPSLPMERELDADRLYVCDRSEEITPGRGARTLVLPGLIRPDERPELLARLRAFLRLPSAFQELISRIPEGEPGRVLAVANVERVAALFPQQPEDLRVLLDGVGRTGVSLGATHIGAPLPHRFAFDLVWEARTPAGGTWRESSLHCEKAPAGASMVPGEARPLSEIPAVAARFESI
ncbi:MAG: hypothetical protein L3K19_08985 [Thermoplasmata archaeon]|nr:hypothetical protein [Thermoplasmata archaeon]